MDRTTGGRTLPFTEQMGTWPSLGTQKEFWWEREWRHQGDFDISGRPIILCPAADQLEIRAVLEEQGTKAIDEPSFIDPQWSLEQIIGKLAGFTMDDLGAF